MHVTAPRDTSLFSDLDVDAVVDAPLGTTTWIGVGGRADLLVSPRSVEALKTLVSRCSREGLPLRVLGSGANLLVADEGVSGIVVKLDQPAFREVGPTGCGKTEIARRLAKLVDAPFIKAPGSARLAGPLVQGDAY